MSTLAVTSAEFRMESANCSGRNPLIVRAESSKCPRGHTRTAARLYADFPRGRLRKKLSFPSHVPYIHMYLTC